MIKIKYNAFTLPEVLITLTIVGALAVLVLPGLIKDMNNKANMALLQGTVANLSDAVQQEIIKKGAKYITDTDIFSKPEKFLSDHFDYSKISRGNNITYKSLSGSTKEVKTPSGEVILKNGVYIGIVPDTHSVVIDINGDAPPNTIGVDYFEVEIVPETDSSLGVRMGDVGAFSYSNLLKVQQDCYNGSADKCYAVVERSGFEPSYMDSLIVLRYDKDLSTTVTDQKLNTGF